MEAYRNVNAARNLRDLAAGEAGGSLNASGETVRPGLAGHVVLNQETGTAFAGKTGTAGGNCWLRDGARAH